MTAVIRDVRAIAVRVPLRRPVRFSTRLVEGREYVLVWVETEDGAVGTGHTYAGTRGGQIVRDVVCDLLRPVLLGANAEDIAARWADLYQETLLLGRRGAALRALSAVDIALHDRAAIAAGAPLWKHLGGTDPVVAAYASGGYYSAGAARESAPAAMYERSDYGGGAASDRTPGPTYERSEYSEGDPLRLVEEEMRRNLERGFSAHKMKVGRDFALDLERVRVARETVGKDQRLALDANNAWREPADAIRFARAVERYDPWWLEEPLPPDDVLGHAAVARALELPVATGELHQTRWEFDALIRERAADILQPDAGVVGGITEWLVVARAAKEAGLPVAPHWDHALHVHLAAATPHCLSVEYFFYDDIYGEGAPEGREGRRLSGAIYNFDALIAPEARLVPRDGTLRAPDRPGHGIVVDGSAVERYRIP